MKPLILITGFLGVPRTEQSALRDPALRFEQTRTAFESMRAAARHSRILLALTGDRAEYEGMVRATGWAANDCRWFDQDDADVPLGKGYLEHRLLRNSIRQWELEAADPLVIKLTAKYVVENIQTVLRYASTTRHPIYGWGRSSARWIDSRCFLFRPRAYLQMSPILDRIDDRAGHYMEHALYQCMKSLDIRPGVARARPILNGWSGTSGRKVRTPTHKRLLIRAMSLGL